MSIFLAFIRFFVATATIVSFLILFFLTMLIWYAFNEGMEKELEYHNVFFLLLTFIIGCITWSMLNKKIKRLQEV